MPRTDAASSAIWAIGGPLLSAAALVALGAILWSADWGETLRPLLSARAEWLVIALVLALAVEILKTARWLTILDLRVSSLPRLLALVFSSRLLNTLTPLRAGDVWRVASASRTEGRPILLVTGSVILEKALDGTLLAVVAIVFIGSAGISAGTDSRTLAPPILAIALACLLAVDAGRRITIRMGLSGWLDSAAHLREASRLAGIALLSVLGIAAGLLVNMAVLTALGLPSDPAIGAAMLLSAYASGLLPAAPAQIGTFEIAVGGALMASGIGSGAAVAAAVAVHLVLLGGLAVGGILSLPLGSIGLAPVSSIENKKAMPSTGQENA